LSLAGKEIAETNAKALDVAVKYGYDNAAAFTKAFARFHGVTPSDVKYRKSAVKYYAPLLINIDVRGGFAMKRRLIPDFPVIEYDGNNAAFFNYLLRITLECMGENADQSKLIALSGEGNRFCWTPGKWAFGNELTESINETPFETQYRVLSAMGWDAKYITVQRNSDGKYMNTDRMQIRQDFMNAVDNGFPIITRLEMADNDLNIFFGYANEGERIIGYNYNANHMKGNDADPSAVNIPFEFDDWESTINGYIILQGKAEEVDERSTALATFRNIIKHARKQTEIRGKKVGFTAWEAFLHDLEHTDMTETVLLAKDAPENWDDSQNVEHRMMIYCDAMCQIWARNGALNYYRSLAVKFSEWKSELETAITALSACAGYAAFWNQREKLGMNIDGFKKFLNSDVRKRLADAGCEAMKNDIIAVEQFEKILEKENERIG